MSMYRFDIYAKKFLLKTHFGAYEESGINWCKKYMTRFQKQAANVEMSVKISAKEKQKNNWEYHGQPYIYQRTLIRKPLSKLVGDNESIDS
jgi:hypothetical protein